MGRRMHSPSGKERTRRYVNQLNYTPLRHLSLHAHALRIPRSGSLKTWQVEAVLVNTGYLRLYELRLFRGNRCGLCATNMGEALMARRFTHLVVTSGFLLSATVATDADANWFKKKIAKPVSHTATGAANTVADGATSAAGAIAHQAASDLSKATKFTDSTIATASKGTVDTYKTTIHAASSTYLEAQDRIEDFAKDMEKYGKGELERLLREAYSLSRSKYVRVIARLKSCAQGLVNNAPLTAKLIAKAVENHTEDAETASLMAKFKTSNEFQACVKDSLQTAALPPYSHSGKAKPTGRQDDLDESLNTFKLRSFTFGLLLEASAPVLGGEASIGFAVDINSPKPAFRGWLGIEGTLSTEAEGGASGSLQAALWTNDALHMTGPSLSAELSGPIETAYGTFQMGAQIYFGIPSASDWKKAFVKGKPDVTKMFPFSGLGFSIGKATGDKGGVVFGVGGGYTWTLPKVK